jgi:hypothetical protein
MTSHDVANMRSRDELAWEIICHLYLDEEENAVMIANSIGELKGTVNSVLYERRNLFSSRTTNYSAKPLWSLTQDSIEAYEQIHRDLEEGKNSKKVPLFCGECGSLHPNHTPVCSKFDPGSFKLHIPFKVNYGNEIGLPGYFGIRYGGRDTEVVTKNRIDTMLEFLITQFIPVESNRLYVELYDDPRSDERRNALINHLQGINVPASSPIQELRNKDITWLIGLVLEKDLP